MAKIKKNTTRLYRSFVYGVLFVGIASIASVFLPGDSKSQGHSYLPSVPNAFADTVPSDGDTGGDGSNDSSNDSSGGCDFDSGPDCL